VDALDPDRPPICAVCGVTMVPAELSRLGSNGRDWFCAECEDAEDSDEPPSP
jgi:hypothetical protein